MNSRRREEGEKRTHLFGGEGCDFGKGRFIRYLRTKTSTWECGLIIMSGGGASEAGGKTQEALPSFSLQNGFPLCSLGNTWSV